MPYSEAYSPPPVAEGLSEETVSRISCIVSSRSISRGESLSVGTEVQLSKGIY